jgi:hypothetical protein
VRYLNDSCAFIVQAFEHIHDLFTLARMEIPGRLVGEDDPRIRHHRAGNAAELLTGREIFLAYTSAGF